MVGSGALLNNNNRGFAQLNIWLVFRVYYERPMVIGSLYLKLRQIVRFSSNMILDEMSSAKCRLHEERPLYHIHVVTSR